METVPKWGWLALIMALVVLIGTGIWLSMPTGTSVSATDYPICAPEISRRVNSGETVTITLHKNCWSGPVILPPKKDFLVETIIPGPGKELELLTWDGRRYMVVNGPTHENFKWVGNIRNTVFRLRGDNEAIITVQ